MSNVVAHMSSPESTLNHIPATINIHHCYKASSLEQEIRKVWEIEVIPHEIALNPLDKRCEAYFRETPSRNADRRYIVRLPFKEGPLSLPINLMQLPKDRSTA